MIPLQYITLCCHAVCGREIRYRVVEKVRQVLVYENHLHFLHTQGRPFG